MLNNLENVYILENSSVFTIHLKIWKMNKIENKEKLKDEIVKFLINKEKNPKETHEELVIPDGIRKTGERSIRTYFKELETEERIIKVGSRHTANRIEVYLQDIDAADNVTVRKDRIKTFIEFCVNDYILACNEKVIERFIDFYVKELKNIKNNDMKLELMKGLSFSIRKAKNENEIFEKIRELKLARKQLVHLLYDIFESSENSNIKDIALILVSRIEKEDCFTDLFAYYGEYSNNKLIKDRVEREIKRHFREKLILKGDIEGYLKSSNELERNTAGEILDFSLY